MRLDPKLVHPSIFQATDRVLFSSEMSTPSKGAMKAVAAHQKVWFREYGVGCVAYVLGVAVTFGIAASVAHTLPIPMRLWIILAWMVAVAATGFLAFRRNQRQLTGTELAALLPLVDLTDPQRAYAETVIALDRSGRSKAEIEDAMTALNALLDEERRLLDARDLLSPSSDDGGALQAERERLTRRIAEARDPDARQALEQSLLLLDERAAAFEGKAARVERIDAHLELLRQAVLATRDAALHQGAPVALDLGTDALRSAVALARTQAQETERALAELRTI